MCFRWAIDRALNPVDDNPQRLTKELIEQAKEFNWEGITFPTKVKDISIWETNNNININLFGFDDEAKKIYTIKMGELKNPLETINLFLHDDNHYCVVKDLSRLVSSQLSKKEHAKHLSLWCLNAFGSEDLLGNHEELCSKHKLQHHIYPKPGEFTKFKNVERLHEMPAAFYCDFEGFVEPISYAANDPSKPYTKTILRADSVS